MEGKVPNGACAYQLRPGTLEDAEVVMNIVNLAYEVENGISGVGFKNSPRLLNPTDGLVEAYAEGRVVVAQSGDGMLVGVIVWELQPDKLYFGPLATLPKYAGRGVGKMLMNEVYKIASGRGLSTIEIWVVNVRVDIISMYERMGYVLCGEAPFPYPDRLTRHVFFLIYRKQLTT
jgi:ribosomal protein S18 acetylase RimI-like enzyme